MHCGKPTEALWSNLKGVELVNLAGEVLNDVVAAAERGVQRIRHTPPSAVLLPALLRPVPM
jgi:hypothetical protein